MIIPPPPGGTARLPPDYGLFCVNRSPGPTREMKREEGELSRLGASRENDENRGRPDRFRVVVSFTRDKSSYVLLVVRFPAPDKPFYRYPDP